MSKQKKEKGHIFRCALLFIQLLVSFLGQNEARADNRPVAEQPDL